MCSAGCHVTPTQCLFCACEGSLSRDVAKFCSHLTIVKPYRFQECMFWNVTPWWHTRVHGNVNWFSTIDSCDWFQPPYTWVKMVVSRKEANEINIEHLFNSVCILHVSSRCHWAKRKGVLWEIAFEVWQVCGELLNWWHLYTEDSAYCCCSMLYIEMFTGLRTTYI